jgi:hypothetical protein
MACPSALYSITLRFVLIGAWFAVCAGCASTTTLPPTEARHYAAAKQLHEARAARESAEKRAAHYLAAADNAGPLLGEGAEAPEVRDIYNTAVAELTGLLRSADDGRLWNRPLTLTAGSATYRLRFAPASRPDGTWAPGFFDIFRTPPARLLPTGGNRQRSPTHPSSASHDQRPLSTFRDRHCRKRGLNSALGFAIETP